MKPERYITFKIETAENMDKYKVVLLTHPENRKMLVGILQRLQKALEKEKGD